MKRERQQRILEIISAKQIATQQELASELARSGVAATQSSVSRDIVELGLTKLDGYYAAPQEALSYEGPIVNIDTAGENLIVVKTRIGQATATALAIDNAELAEIVGTVAGDDTILIAVKNSAAQRLAVKRIVKLFARATPLRARAQKHAGRSSARALWPW